MQGSVRVGYSIEQQRNKMLLAMTEAGKQLMKERALAEKKFKDEGKHLGVYDIHSGRADVTQVTEGTYSAVFRHSTKPVEKGIVEGSRILNLKITGWGDKTLFEHQDGQLVQKAEKIQDWEQKHADTLYDAVMSTFN